MSKPLITSFVVMSLFAAVSAEARTSYLLPYNFAPTDAYVTAQAATSENVFAPEGALKVDIFQIIDDKGAVITAKGTAFKEVTLVESALPHEGTFRLTTGTVEGRSMQMAQVDGKWRPVRGQGGPGGQRPAGQAPQGEGGTQPQPPVQSQSQPSAIPADAKTVTVKSMTRADSYISYKKPSDMLPAAEGKGLEIVPVSHPSRLFSGNTFAFTVLLDGQPLSNAAFKVERGGDQYAESSYAFSGVSGADGKAQVVFATAGVYVIEMSQRWQGGDETDPRNWAYSLTIEVAP